MGIARVCTHLIREMLQAFRSRSISSSHQDAKLDGMITPKAVANASSLMDELVARALTAVFGMDSQGRIKKEKALHILENLGLVSIDEEKEKADFDLHESLDDGEDVCVEEVLEGLDEDGLKRQTELLREAFRIFDNDGNGYIDAGELKRVFECLGLDKGWDIPQIEKMLQAVDLNLDDKIDFDEFEFMMLGCK